MIVPSFFTYHIYERASDSLTRRVVTVTDCCNCNLDRLSLNLETASAPGAARYYALSSGLRPSDFHQIVNAVLQCSTAVVVHEMNLMEIGGRIGRWCNAL